MPSHFIQRNKPKNLSKGGPKGSAPPTCPSLHCTNPSDASLPPVCSGTCCFCQLRLFAFEAVSAWHVLPQISLWPTTSVFWGLGFLLCRDAPRHMEVPRAGVKLELQLPPYTTAYTTATQDPSRNYSLHHSSWQHPIPHPLSEARD